MIPNKLFSENRDRIHQALPENGFAVVHSADLPWLSADGHLNFVQNSDLFYLTGVDQEDTVLVLCPGHNDPAKREVLFVRETSDLIKIWEGQKLNKEQAKDVSGIETVEWNDQVDEYIRSLAQTFDRIFLNYNEHARSGSPIGITPDDLFRQKIQNLYPNHRYERLAPHLHRARVAKSPLEISLIERACQITGLGFRRVLGFVKPGVKEYEIEAELIHEFKRHGSRGFSYEPIIASGENACVLHYLQNDQPCKDGDLLLMDVAAEYANYNSDLTRTIPVNGKFTDRQRDVYNAVLRVFRLCIDELIVPGKNIRKQFNLEVARAMEEELIGLGLLAREKVEEERAQGEDLKEEKRAYRKYFMHGTSHSLGLDVHDVAPAEPEFVENMVVTVEPGIYLPDEGFGIRLENDIVVKKSGNVDLMAHIPIEADEIEALMAG
ncbi:MAG: aminopeptidase P N-terminal domain-containing protein [Verrucomicrobiales bacterium]|nr:aminopeptidase P N-terminal domain-containing protein [Verrucomicrobiales bacterium]